MRTAVAAAVLIATQAMSAMGTGAAELRPVPPNDRPQTTRDSGQQIITLLQRVAAYVTTYEQALPAIVADEDYTQRFIVGPKTEARRLRSDLLSIRDEAEGWIGFRDVYEVDGRAIRDRTDRLTKLFLEPLADPRSQAIRLAEESARFNIAPQVARTINVPLLAMQFLRPSNQRRSSFAIAGTKTTHGVTTTVVEFQEVAKPGLIRTEDGAKARGRFWIEPGSGRIQESELLVTTLLPPRVVISATIHVVYAEEPKLHLWVPSSMVESYQGYGVIDGRATYSHFRRFNVATTETIK